MENLFDYDIYDIEELIFTEKKKLEQLEIKTKNEINEIKEQINDEIDKVKIIIDRLKDKIRAKKQIIRTNRFDIEEIEKGYQRMLNRENVYIDYSVYCIKNAIYKAKYYDFTDLSYHVVKVCRNKNCSTCLAHSFVTGEYGDWESKSMEKWINDFLVTNRRTLGQYQRFSNAPYLPCEYNDIKIDTISNILTSEL